jgi:hypothetical protein
LNTETGTWLSYQGRWGQSVDFTGWEAPNSPWMRTSFKKSLQRMLLDDELTIKSNKRYESGKQWRMRLLNVHTV